MTIVGFPLGMRPIVVIILVTILFFLAVAVLHGPPTEEELCVDEGGVWQEGSCHPAEL